MKARFLSVVPRGARVGAQIFLGCAVLAGLIMGYFGPFIDHRPHNPIHLAGTMAIGLGTGLLLGAILSCWILGLGYVYGDAQRRGMRPILWTLIAALVPHLLGFLLYFAMRQPISTACDNCGQSNPLNRPFCSWCGSQRPKPPSGDASLDPVHQG